jgi:hypothetical protein
MVRETAQFCAVFSSEDNLWRSRDWIADANGRSFAQGLCGLKCNQGFAFHLNVAEQTTIRLTIADVRLMAEMRHLATFSGQTPDPGSCLWIRRNRQRVWCAAPSSNIAKATIIDGTSNLFGGSA